MVLYLEYELYKRRLTDTERMYDEILLENESLFNKTQPKSLDYGKERVAGGSPQNAFDEYLIQKEKQRIDERLEEARNMVNERKRLLSDKEQELRQSKDMYDRVYKMRHLDKFKVNRIASMTGYSEASIYRILKIISETIR